MGKSRFGGFGRRYRACAGAISLYSARPECKSPYSVDYCYRLTTQASHKDPFPIANPEQTASIASFLLFAFLDPVIYKAHRVEHLPHDEFPPLCDYDATKHLIKRGYSVSHQIRSRAKLPC